MSRAGSIINRLTRPVAVIGSREAFIHLCEHCNLDPNNNDVFCHVQFVWDCDGREFSRVLTIAGHLVVKDRLRIVSAARARLRNDQ